MASYEQQQEHLRRLMEEVSSGEEEPTYNDESDEGEVDFVEERENDSDTEQEISEGESEDCYQNELCFMGKDKVTKWMKRVPANNVRTRKQDKVLRLPISRLCTRTLKTPIEIFKYFFNDAMVNLIVKHTNEYIDLVSDNFQRERDARPTDSTEIHAFLGLLFYAGVLKSNRLNLEELWESDGSGIEMFRLTMSIKRFKFLLRCLRFDSKETREERKKIDKLAPIREFFDIFVDNCKVGYSPSENMTIDEKLEGFRGKCSFRQYIPSKPNKYGLKIFALCDARMYYTMNLEIYVGQQPDGPYKVSNSPNCVVERLCEPIKGSGRNVTLDNWFTSVPLVEKLYTEYNLTVIGTLRKNKKELPSEFSRPTHPPGASMFGFTKNCTLVSYIPKKKKNVLLLSSNHHDDNIDQISRKPEIIIDYNNTKGGVDTVDRLCANYNVARNTRRWPMVLFYSILNMAGINSLVVYDSSNPTVNTTRRRFLRNLACDLIQPHLRIRVGKENIPRQLKNRLREICSIPENTVRDRREGETGRCAVCSSKRNRKTRYYCRKCTKFVCLEHTVVVCDDCFQNNSSSDDA